MSKVLRTHYNFDGPTTNLYPALKYEDIDLEMFSFRKHFADVKMVHFGTTRWGSGPLFHSYVCADPIALADERMAIHITIAFKDGVVMAPNGSLSDLLDATADLQGYGKLSNPNPSTDESVHARPPWTGTSVDV